jgi:hypothetical protein
VADHGSMMDRRKLDRWRNGGGGRPKGDGRRAPDAPPAFDAWLTQQLRAIYDPVLDEPLPEQLVRMLQSGKPRNDEGSRD